MGRVSLTEDYDDRSVISKLNEMDKRVKENTTVVTAAEASAKASAQAAQETADRFAGSVGAVVQNANAQINASKAQVDQAKAEVDTTVTTVAQAVQTANDASASAQQSAQTVAGYDTRLTAVEDADTQNVKIGGAQYITGTKTFVVARTKNSLETKADVPPQQRQTQPVQVIDRNDEQVMFNQLLTNTDGTRQYRTNVFSINGTRAVVENVFLNADGTGYSTCVNPSADAPSSAIVNKRYVESTDGATNNLVHRTSDETITGTKTIVSQYGAVMIGLKGLNVDVTANSYQASIPRIGTFDKNNEQLWQLETTISEAGVVTLNCRIRNSDGTIKSVTLAQGDLKQ